MKLWVREFTSSHPQGKFQSLPFIVHHGKKKRKVGGIRTREKILQYCCCCSVAKPCLTLYDSMNCSMPGFSVLHYLLQFAQTCIH